MMYIKKFNENYTDKSNVLKDYLDLNLSNLFDEYHGKINIEKLATEGKYEIFIKMSHPFPKWENIYNYIIPFFHILSEKYYIYNYSFGGVEPQNTIMYVTYESRKREKCIISDLDNINPDEEIVEFKFRIDLLKNN